jgi:glycosyltransferase involved in cell wall biosynthesis
LKELVVCRDQIRFLGFKNQSELPQLYAASDVMVLPSENEPWGLVINEAMAAGLPVVVTNAVGAAPDLVEGQDTGFVYPVGNIARLVDVLRMLAQDPSLCERMGRNAQTLISRWDVKNSAAGIVRAIQTSIPSREQPR